MEAYFSLRKRRTFRESMALTSSAHCCSIGESPAAREVAKPGSRIARLCSRSSSGLVALRNLSSLERRREHIGITCT